MVTIFRLLQRSLCYCHSENNRTEGWDFFTLLLMAVAAIDYMISFRYFGKAKQLKK
ncbi:MAG: YdiK family protein [Bacillus sp. (in: Bacteria)]|nr:YdiK family protein [Bacillus sp. (in: firmicutes)]